MGVVVVVVVVVVAGCLGQCVSCLCFFKGVNQL